jgi:probable HAF family extracellular repeat protein
MTATKVRFAVLLAVVGLAATACLTTTAPTMVVDAARAHDVNEGGVMVGSRWFGPPNISLEDHAYRYDLSTGTLTDLGTLGGTAASAEAINDGGTIAGWSQLANGQRRAFVLEPGSPMTDLGTLSPASTTPFSSANDINAGGAVVGWSTVETGAVDAMHPFVREPGAAAMVDLGTLGGTNAVATAINDAGVVVGWSDVAGDGARHAFAYDPATDEMSDLGVLPGGTNSEAVDLNEQGQVTGWSEIAGQADPLCDPTCPLTRGFIHDLGTGTTAELGMPIGESFARPASINEDGIVVGTTTKWILKCSGCSFPTRAIAWEAGTTGAYTIAGQQHGASAINDAGLTVGTGFTISGFSAVPFAYQSQVTLVEE